jgi:hypothetical protein
MRSGAGSGGAGSGDGPDCPLTFKAALIGPVAGACAVGDVLDVIFQSTPPPGRIVCVHRGTGATVGAIGGIPGLSKVIECLQAGVQYEALVNNIAGGRVDLTVNRV